MKACWIKNSTFGKIWKTINSYQHHQMKIAKKVTFFMEKRIIKNSFKFVNNPFKTFKDFTARFVTNYTVN